MPSWPRGYTAGPWPLWDPYARRPFPVSILDASGPITAAPNQCPRKAPTMTDILLLAAGLGLFGLTVLYGSLCDQL